MILKSLHRLSLHLWALVAQTRWTDEEIILLDIKMVTRSVSPKPQSKRHQGELARKLARERVMCPGCGKYMAIATLQYTHVCAGAGKEPTEEVIQRRLQVATSRAIAGFWTRHGVQEDSDQDTREERPQWNDTELGDGELEV